MPAVGNAASVGAPANCSKIALSDSVSENVLACLADWFVTSQHEAQDSATKECRPPPELGPVLQARQAVLAVEKRAGSSMDQ